EAAPQQEVDIARVRDRIAPALAEGQQRALFRGDQRRDPVTAVPAFPGLVDIHLRQRGRAQRASQQQEENTVTQASGLPLPETPAPDASRAPSSVGLLAYTSERSSLRKRTHASFARLCRPEGRHYPVPRKHTLAPTDTHEANARSC